MGPHRTTSGRQPLRLPSVFSGWRVALAAVALACAPWASARAQTPDGEIRIVAVDSSWPRSLDDPDLSKPLPHPLADAVEDAVATVNSYGGVLGRRLVVVRDNDECSSREAEVVAKRTVARKPHLVIGHACSGGAIRAATIYAEAEVLMIATGPRHPRLTAGAGRPGIFRLAGRDDRQADAIANLLARTFPAARVAIVHDSSLQSRGMADEIRRAAEAAKVAPVLVASYPSGIKDHAALVAQLIAAKSDLVIFPGQAFEASMILDQAHVAGARVRTVIGTDVLAANAPPKRLLAATGEFLVMLPWSGGEYADTLRPADAGALTPETLLAMAAVEFWTLAALEAKSLETGKVGAALRRIESRTMVGPLRFDEKGDAVVPSYVPHVWREGRWQARD